MRIRVFILAVAIFMALSCSAGAAAVSMQEIAKEQESTLNKTMLYTFMDYQGKICIFQHGELVLDTGINTDGLRNRDRQLLEAGIETYSYEDILSLLEDFSS